jgi:hypothetical protein
MKDGTQAKLMAALELRHRVMQHVAHVDAGDADEASPVLLLHFRHQIVRRRALALRAAADYQVRRLAGHRHGGLDVVLADLFEE